MAGGQEVGRFAPSTTGPAHPGTLLAALLCWLDARSRGARLVLRLEDLDPDRSRPEHVSGMERDLAWSGLDFDARELQSEARARHEAALDVLAEAGRLYPCRCSRADLRVAGVRTPDGGFRYAGACRARSFPPGGWRASEEPLRVRLDPGHVDVRDEGGSDLGHDPEAAFGDPIVRRRDGSVAYHLAGIVDDAAAGVTRIVRGRDLATTTPTQNALRRLLGFPEPTHRHHLVLLERQGEKLAKLHGAVSIDALRPFYDAGRLTAVLARAAGLATASSITPAELLQDFAWPDVASEDRLLTWTGSTLELP